MLLSSKLSLVYTAIQIAAYLCPIYSILLQRFPDEKIPQRSYLRETKGRMFQGRIYNGFPVKNRYSAERYQYFALSSPFRIPFCGGVLIATNVVLTAAHCKYWHGKEVFKEVSIGVYDAYAEASTFESFSVLEAIQHPGFVESTLENDLMVLILDGNSTKTPICMTLDYSLKERQKLRVLGYGFTELGNPSNTLIETDVNFISNKKCQRRFSGWERNNNDDYYGEWRSEITEDMMCAHSKKGKDACDGDSGGPLILSGDDDTGRGDILVGIVSWGIKCGVNPGVYSRVRSEVQWIMEKVKNAGGILPRCEF